MKANITDPQQIVAAIFISVLVLLSSTLLADQVQKSEVYQQSKLLTSIFSQDSVGVLDVVSQEKNLQMVTQFVGAVASAYINFELIPVNEAKTFAAIFESLNPDITINKFEYQRKDLIITGTAPSQDSYMQFLTELRQRKYFGSVSGHSYTDTHDVVRFELYCSAAATGEARLAFAPF